VRVFFIYRHHVELAGLSPAPPLPLRASPLQPAARTAVVEFTHGANVGVRASIRLRLTRKRYARIWSRFQPAAPTEATPPRCMRGCGDLQLWRVDDLVALEQDVHMIRQGAAFGISSCAHLRSICAGRVIVSQRPNSVSASWPCSGTTLGPSKSTGLFHTRKKRAPCVHPLSSVGIAFANS